MYKKILYIIVSILIAAVSAGCSGNITDIFTGDGDQQYEESKTVNFAVSDIRTLNPVVSRDEDTYFISKLIYQSLFILDDNLAPDGELVSDYKVGSDGKTVTMTLVKDACFSDGEKVQADDVKFSIESYMAAGSKSIYYSKVKGISSVTTDGKYKVKVRFKNAGDGGVKNLTFPILPAHLYTTAEITQRDSSFRPVGSGSYKVASYKSGSKLVLSKNKYTNSIVPDNRLVFTVYSDGNVLNLAEGNLVSFTVNKNIERQTEVGSKSLKTSDFCSNQLETVIFNCRSEILGSSEMRKAIAYSIDTEEIISKAYYNSAVSTNTLFYPGYLGIENTGDLYSQDTKKAEDILKELGAKDTDKDGILNTDDGGNIKITIIVNSDQARNSAAQIIEESIESLDIDAQVVTLSDSEYRKRLRNGKFDIAFSGISFSDCYDVRGILGGSSDYTGYKDRTLQKLAVKLNSCIEEEKMIECAADINEKIKDNLNYYPVCYRTYAVIASNELTGEISSMFNDIYRGCEGWYSVYQLDASDEEK